MTHHPHWKKRPMKRNTYPQRIKRPRGPAEPTPQFLPGKDNMISVDVDIAIMKPGSGNREVAYKPALLLMQICAFTGARYVVHGVRYGDQYGQHEFQVSQAFNKAGLDTRFLYPHWTVPHTPGEPYQAYVERWTQAHPDTQKLVVIDGGHTFEGPEAFTARRDFTTVSSMGGLQMRHARRVVEALGGDWKAFKTWRRQELAAMRRDPKHLSKALRPA